MKKLLILSSLLLLPVLSRAAGEVQVPQVGSAAAAQQPGAEQRPLRKSTGERFLELYLPQLFALMGVLVLASEAITRKAPACGRAVKKTWNWALLVSFLVCVTLGFVLLFPLDKAAKGLAFSWHIWAGVVCGWAGTYHALKRIRCMC